MSSETSEEREELNKRTRAIFDPSILEAMILRDLEGIIKEEKLAVVVWVHLVKRKAKARARNFVGLGNLFRPWACAASALSFLQRPPAKRFSLPVMSLPVRLSPQGAV